GWRQWARRWRATPGPERCARGFSPSRSTAPSGRHNSATLRKRCFGGWAARCGRVWFGAYGWSSAARRWRQAEMGGRNLILSGGTDDAFEPTSARVRDIIGWEDISSD